MVHRTGIRAYNHEIVKKGGPKLFMQDNDPSQNSVLASTIWRRLGARLVPLPPRSGDFHFVENIFHIVKMQYTRDISGVFTVIIFILL